MNELRVCRLSVKDVTSPTPAGPDWLFARPLHGGVARWPIGHFGDLERCVTGALEARGVAEV
jgi:hypothetical protein